MPAPKKKAASSTTNSKNTKKGTSYSRSNQAYENVAERKAKKELEKAKLNYTETKYNTRNVPTEKKYRAGRLLDEKQTKGLSKTLTQRKKATQALQSYGESVRTKARSRSAFKKANPNPRPGQFN